MVHVQSAVLLVQIQPAQPAIQRKGRLCRESRQSSARKPTRFGPAKARRTVLVALRRRGSSAMATRSGGNDLLLELCTSQKSQDLLLKKGLFSLLCALTILHKKINGNNIADNCFIIHFCKMHTKLVGTETGM